MHSGTGGQFSIYASVAFCHNIAAVYSIRLDIQIAFSHYPGCVRH
ncbi:MAG: hypothetical protein OFPI_35820 [Osedax symbiont Rs2]|nr:MAG: hypothetical protein OFPI_35820 [Osedax symbiont Rs2]